MLPHLHLHLHQVLGRYAALCRQSSFFVGIAHEVATTDVRIGHTLGPNPLGFHLQHLPDNLTDEAIADGKRGLVSWVVAQSLRELIEQLGEMTQPVFDVGMQALINAKSLSVEDAQSERESFVKVGLIGKRSMMKRLLKIKMPYGKELESMNRVRNCMSHRSSIVGREDCDQNSDVLTVSWLGFDSILVFDDGREETFRPPQIVPEGGATLALKFMPRTKEFKLGARLNFDAHELSEIIFLFLRAAQGFADAFLARAPDLGINRAQAAS